MVVVLGITVAGYDKVQPLPLRTLPFAQPDSDVQTRHGAFHARVLEACPCLTTRVHITQHAVLPHTARELRPILVLRFWISEGLTQAESEF